MKLIALRVLAGLLLVFGFGMTHAQSWPQGTVRIVVPYPAGTEPDMLARDIGTALAKKTGKAFVVDNKPGANAIIGTDAVVKADGDGATLLMVDRLSLVTNPLLYNTLAYKWEQSLKPVTDLARVSLMVGVRSGLPVKRFSELQAYAKAHPGQLNVGTGGNGHVTHIGMEMLARAHSMSYSYVPYKGVGPSVVGLASGEIDVAMAGGLALQTQAQSGRLRLLVIGAPQRAAFAPDVPTIVEAGGQADSIPSTVFALFAPAKVPDAMIRQINQAVAEVVKASAVFKTYSSRGLDVGVSQPSETLAAMKQDGVRYEKIIREADIKLE